MTSDTDTIITKARSTLPLLQYKTLMDTVLLLAGMTWTANEVEAARLHWKKTLWQIFYSRSAHGNDTIRKTHKNWSKSTNGVSAIPNQNILKSSRVDTLGLSVDKSILKLSHRRSNTFCTLCMAKDECIRLALRKAIRDSISRALLLTYIMKIKTSLRQLKIVQLYTNLNVVRENITKTSLFFFFLREKALK